jgi:hypothetical protein
MLGPTATAMPLGQALAGGTVDVGDVLTAMAAAAVVWVGAMAEHQMQGVRGGAGEGPLATGARRLG